MEAHGDGPGGLKLYSNPHGSVRCYHEGCRCPDCENAKERQREYDRARYRANPAAEAARSYRQTPRGRAIHQASNALRRARVRGAEGHCSTEQLQARVDYYGGMCSYCQSAPFEHIDHAIPVARGGSNWPSNLRPSCGDCNLRKWTKTAMEFLP